MGGLFFLDLVGPFSDTVYSESVVDVKLDGPCAVICYQVDNCKSTLSAEHFSAHSQVYILVHFPVKTGYEECIFLDQALKNFGLSLDNIFTYTLKFLTLHHLRSQILLPI